jgi:L-lactate dehydrogenase (cytochrome)
MGTGPTPARLATTVLGTPLSLPVILAPCGLVSVMHPDGGVGIARAAAEAGTLSVLSTVAGTELEVVAAEAPGPKWFQLYSPGRAESEQLIRRAAAAGYQGLVITIDTPELGNRERDVHNGVAPPLRINARTALRLAPQVLTRPGWGLRLAAARVESLRRRRGPGMSVPTFDVPPPPPTPRPRVLTMFHSPFTWEDIAWARERWSGPLLVKGILSGADARRAADAGADAVIVSNHGGRQLDGAPATMTVLPEVVDAVGDRVEVLIDGGIRRGGDVVKALAVGARAALIGRAYLYGLAVGGQAGVTRIVEILETEMTRTLGLLGCPSVSDLDRSWLGGPV